jgi:hypothetical protein
VNGRLGNESDSCVNLSVSCFILLKLCVFRSRASNERIMETSPLAITAYVSSWKLLGGLQLNWLAGPTLNVGGEISLWIVSVCLCSKLGWG